jgi:anti-sigma-K factor RskA
MKLQNPQLRRAVAGEYALGTLAGRARRRFDRLLRNDEALQHEVAIWEQQLAGLQVPSPRIRPRPQVWVQIARAIAPTPYAIAPAPAPTATTPPSAAPAPAASTIRSTTVVGAPPAANQSRFWRNWAGLATAAVLALVVALVARAPQTVTPPPVAQQASPSYVALLQMPNSTMHWTVNVAPKEGRITLAANGEAPPLDGKSLELWWLGANGKPVAIGLLPTHGNGTMPMPAGASGTPKLAVSVEPAGGSPTGQPTGPVVIVADVVESA